MAGIIYSIPGSSKSSKTLSICLPFFLNIEILAFGLKINYNLLDIFLNIKIILYIRFENRCLLQIISVVSERTIHFQSYSSSRWHVIAMQTVLTLRIWRSFDLTLLVEEMDLLFNTKALQELSLSAKETTTGTAVMSSQTRQMYFT